ncbi:piRNA biogenesis protein EXD1 [Discoglossus pictus]
MDTIIDPGFLSRVIGKTIKITLHYGCYQGVLLHIDPERTILVNKVKDLGTGKTIPETKLFLGQDILNVELQEESENTSEHEDERQDTGERENGPSDEKAKPGKEQESETREHPAVAPQEIPPHTLQALKRAVDEDEVEYIVVDQLQPMFGPAIRHMKNQKVLSLAAAGLNLRYHGKLCWLQVATKNRVYLFDILVLGPKVFKNGLQMVLEDRGILKVIHDCRWLADFLSHQYKVVLSNVFDTQVCNVYLFFMETGGFLPSHTSTLEECLKHHLNMPHSRVSYLTHKQKLVKDNQKIWFKRPMLPPLLKMLALEVAHLLPLRMAMLDTMMSDFTALVDGYLNAFRVRTAPNMGSAELSCSELPEELQQLTVLQQVRREKALKEHQVNSKGFLTRVQIHEKKEQQRPETFKIQMYMPSATEPVMKLNDDMRLLRTPSENKEAETYTLEKEEAKSDAVPGGDSEQDMISVAGIPYVSPMRMIPRMSTPFLLTKSLY